MNPPQPSCVQLCFRGLGLSQGVIGLLRMSLLYLIPSLPHQEGMIVQPEYGRPTECRDKVPLDHTGRRPIRPRGPRWVGEGVTGLFDQQTGDSPTGDLCRGPLEEGQEKDFLQRILHNLEGYPCVRGDVLHKGQLLMEVLLQACICGQRVMTRQPGKVGQKIPPAFHLLPKQAFLRHLGPYKSPDFGSLQHTTHCSQR